MAVPVAAPGPERATGCGSQGRGGRIRGGRTASLPREEAAGRGLVTCPPGYHRSLTGELNATGQGVDDAGRSGPRAAMSGSPPHPGGHRSRGSTAAARPRSPGRTSPRGHLRPGLHGPRLRSRTDHGEPIRGAPPVRRSTHGRPRAVPSGPQTAGADVDDPPAVLVGGVVPVGEVGSHRPVRGVAVNSPRHAPDRRRRRCTPPPEQATAHSEGP